MDRPFSFVAVGQSLIKRDIRDHPDPGYPAVVKIVRDADIAFTNLETTIRGPFGGWPMKGGFFGCSDPIVLDTLKDIGFSMLSLSNNHAFDLGPAGILSTLSEVAQRGFIHAGIGVDATGAARPGYGLVGRAKVGLVAMDAGPSADIAYAQDAFETPYNRVPSRPGTNALRVQQQIALRADELDLLRRIKAEMGHDTGLRKVQKRQPDDDAHDRLHFYGLDFVLGAARERRGAIDPGHLTEKLDSVRTAAGNSDFVVAYVHHHHWEPNLPDVPGWIRDVARRCISAGADAFVSHGVPMLQGIEIFEGRPIFYGLGNFIFHSGNPTRWHHPDAWRSVVATCRFGADGGLDRIELDPITIGPEQAIRADDYSCREAPLLADHETRAGILERLAERSLEFGSVITRDGSRGIIGVR